MQNTCYWKERDKKLSNKQSYLLKQMSAKTVEKKVNTAWKKIYLQNEFPPFVQNIYNPFYGVSLTPD